MPRKVSTFLKYTIGALAIVWCYALFFPVVYQTTGVVYYLKPSTSKPVVIQELSQQGLIHVSPVFAIYVFLHKGTPLKTGEYLFPRFATPWSIWRQMTSGTGLYYHRFTIVPGQTFIQIQNAMKQADGLRPLAANWSDKQVMSAIGHPELAPEGEFFPETYYYLRDDADITLLKRAFDLMQQRLGETWTHRQTTLPYKNIYQALIAASLIEKEAFLETERPLIAGVIVNRLKKNMLLQIDPTVIYGLGLRYDGTIHKKDLLDNNPYNTYVRKGLPPTPIASPSMASIEAAMNPNQHDYLYFVARGDGSHRFSKTLAEHNIAVKAARKSST